MRCDWGPLQATGSGHGLGKPNPRTPRPGYGRGVIRKRVVVTGEVQGVFFRDTCRRLAAQQRVAGWVRNLPDGSVEAAFEGDPVGVDRLVAWIHGGPPQAIVDRVAVFGEPPEGATSFQILPTPRS